MRKDNRRVDQLRPVKIIPGFVELPAGSALIEMGKTRVLCTASVEAKVPRWLHQAQLKQREKSGWVTAEYSILPGAGPHRTQRASSTGRKSGRTYEIQRLIGRSFRSVVDLKKLGPRTIWIDCDVIQADGGTRTASITGGFVALMKALESLREKGLIKEIPVQEHLAAISIGVRDGEVILDLDYDEDKEVDVDCNVVMTEGGELIEVQGTGEKKGFSREQLAKMLDYADPAIQELIKLQKSAGEIR
ncbi:MAG: ribonuclease PH [Candidatus Auribacterota bacterium]|nr:ribonuclease PH [Candidatus Auribacterota bacterium]